MFWMTLLYLGGLIESFRYYGLQITTCSRSPSRHNMKRPPNILHLLLTALTTAGALRITMRTPLLSSLRDGDVTIPCDISDLNTGRAISLTWKRRSENGTVHDVYEYIDGVAKPFRPGCSMDVTAIRRGNAELRIPRVQFSDEGEYVCSVINTPDLAEGRTTLQVSAPPSAEVTPADPTIELGTEKTMTCEVHNFYPKEVSIRWAQYRKGSSKCELLDIWTCAKSVLENSDGTFNVTSLLTLNPKMEDNGNTYSCLIKHRSIQTELTGNFTLTVTEREDNTGAVIGAVIVTLLSVGFLGLLSFLYIRFMKKDPPTLSEITGNDKLIDMNRTTLTCQIMNFRPNNIELSVCIRRYGEKTMRTIYTWRSGGHLAPVTMSREDSGGDDMLVDVEQGRLLMNGSAGHEDGPLQLEVEPRIIEKKLGTFTCQCSLHITPSYELDNGAELSVHVTHPALTSPASVYRTLNVIGVSPKLLSVMAPDHVIHDEQVTLTCPINAFKPRALSITWLKKDGNQQETELVTWTPERCTTHIEKYTHNLKGDEHKDKSYSVLSALTMKATVTEDDRVTYICRTFHPATNHRDQREETMRVTAVPVLDSILKVQEIIFVGGKLDLSCRIHSFYPRDIQVTWYTEDDVIIPSHTTDPLQEYGQMSHVSSTSSYTPTMKDLGKNVRCEVRHDSLSNPRYAILTLKDIISVPTLGDIRCDPAQPEPGKPVTFSCEIHDMYPGDPAIQWQLSGKELPAREVDFKKDPKSGTFSGTTKVTFTPQTSDHSTEISLEVNHCGKRLPKKTHVNLKGLPLLSDITFDPRTPDYGRPLTLRCDVTGCYNSEDIAQIIWSEGGEVKRSHMGDVLSCYLTIRPTAGDYGKVYTCSVTHRDKWTIKKERCLLLPERPPTLSDIIVRPARVTANQEASFQVTLSGFSPRDLQIKWYKEFSTFPQACVTMSDPEIGLDNLYKCSSTVTFIPRESDDWTSIRFEVTHNRNVREKRYTLNLKESSDVTKAAQKTGPEKKFGIREIRCVTERPRVGEEVNLVAYIEGCQVDSAEFTWYNGMFNVDEGIENIQDGGDCTSSVTFTPDPGTECTIKLEVFYNYQTVEESYTLRLG